jgi:hypothetical protein
MIHLSLLYVNALSKKRGGISLLTKSQTKICASWEVKTARRDRAPGPIPEKVYRQAPGELACIRPAIQKIR